MSQNEKASSSKPRPAWVARLFPVHPPERRARALKEQVYASFTGLAIVTSLALAQHSSAPDAFLTLMTGVIGITLAGFVAEVIGYQVSHATFPDRREIATMARIALGAIASASIALVAFLSAWIGLFSLELAFRVSGGIYLLTLGVIAMLAARRTRLPLRFQLLSLLVMLGLGAVVIIVLLLSHGH